MKSVDLILANDLNFMNYFFVYLFNCFFFSFFSFLFFSLILCFLFSDFFLQFILNSTIRKGVVFQKAKKKFVQYKDKSGVYGLNFSSESDADKFVEKLQKSLNEGREKLSMSFFENNNNNNKTTITQQ